jgi:Protein of unknown function (DUF3263)
MRLPGESARENRRSLAWGMLVYGRTGRQSCGVSLTDREQAILDFERTWWTRDGLKDALVRELFRVELTDYYQALNELLDRPEALEYDPLGVRRLRRLRDRRRRSRFDSVVGERVEH